MSFEWRKDEEEGWEEQVPVSVVVERPPLTYRLYAAVFIVVVLIGGLVYWQLDRHAQATALSLEAQVFSSVRLLQKAASSGDSELFDTVLSRRDGGWANAQRTLLRGEQYWGREDFGLRWQAGENYTTTIQLAPDLTEAEVSLQQPYAWQQGSRVTETVVLSQTAVFRFGQQQWLLADPDRDFWGESQTIDGDYLTVTFPARDRAIVRRLLPILSSFMEMVCQQTTNTGCASDMQIPILFDTRPVSLYDIRYPAEYPAPGLITVPTPTLLGLPGSEAGVALLAQSYVAHIVPQALPTISGWQGRRPIFYEAIATQQLNDWGLRPSPLNPLVYSMLLNSPVSLQEISLQWASDDFHALVLPIHVQALVAFLMSQGTTAVELQSGLSTPNFWQWANLRPNDPALEEAWLQFLYDHSTFALQPPPLPLPNLDIRLVCGDNHLFRYDGTAKVWRDEMQAYEGQSLVEIVPHDEGLIVAGRYYEEIAKDYRGRAFWVKGEKAIRFSEWRSNSDAPLISSQQHDPAGRKLVFQVQDVVDRNLIRYRLLDLDGCDTEACSLLFLPGWPVWSPDGGSTLIMQEKLSNLLVPQQTQLWRGDANGQIVAELGQGYAPFWLDEDTYGYVRLGMTGLGEIVTADIGDDDVHVFLSMAELSGQLPGPDTAPPLFIANVQANPTIPGRLLVTVVGEDNALLVQVTRLGRRMMVIHDPLVFTDFSPDGRVFVVDEGFSQPGMRNLRLNYGPFEASRQTVATTNSRIHYDWTADSQWLLISHQGFLQVLAPEYDYFQIIPHEFGSCDRVEWVQ